MEGGRRIKRLEFIRETLAAAYVNQQQKTTTKNGTMAAAGDKCRQGACVRVSMCLRAANIDWLLASSLPGLVVGDKRRRIREAVGGHIAHWSAHFFASAEKCQDPDVWTLANIFIFLPVPARPHKLTATCCFAMDSEMSTQTACCFGHKKNNWVISGTQ